MIAASASPRVVPARGRELAARLAALFDRDVEIVQRLNDAHRRLRCANERLWSGLSPDAFGLIYDGAAPPGGSQVAELAETRAWPRGLMSGRGAPRAAGDPLGDPPRLLRVPVGVRGAPPARGRGWRALPAADRGAVRCRLERR